MQEQRQWPIQWSFASLKDDGMGGGGGATQTQKPIQGLFVRGFGEDEVVGEGVGVLEGFGTEAAEAGG